MTTYLDCNATTPMAPEVARVVRHYMEVDFGNAGSRTHEFGHRAKQAVVRAREQVAAVVNAKPDEVIFTSGATEANNLAILGLEDEGRRTGRMHIVSTQIEHTAVLEPLAEMRRRGFEVTLLSPNRGGWVEAERVGEALRDDTLLVSVMHVNNETGVIQDIERIAQAVAGRPALLHVDAAQGFGKVDGIEGEGIDLISVSGHKIYGPKGVGALVARRRKWSRPPLKPLMYGGGQEVGLRPGSVPVALVAGLGEAACRARRHFLRIAIDAVEFREALRSRLADLGFQIVGDPGRVLATTLSIALPGVDSEAAVLALKGEFAVSNGAACTSSEYGESHVLRAMGIRARGFLRFSWSRGYKTDVARRIAELLRPLVACGLND